MDQEHRLSNPKLFAGWAGEDFHSWERAVGAAVTHLSRGDGTVTEVSREAGVISIHVQYRHSDRSYALWEFRNHFTNMTLPEGLARADLIPRAKARRLLQEEAKQAEHEALVPDRRGRRKGATYAR